MLLVGTAILVSGCATVRIKKITSSDQDGLRFYRPDPYILVSADSVGGEKTRLKTEVIWLPNYSEAYAIEPIGRIGKADLTVTLANGWNLTGLTLNRDTKAPETIEKLLAGIGGIAGITGLMDSAELSKTRFSPRLYKLVYSSSGQIVALEEIKLTPN
jgi:hypothetical protein